MRVFTIQEKPKRCFVSFRTEFEQKCRCRVLRPCPQTQRGRSAPAVVSLQVMTPVCSFGFSAPAPPKTDTLQIPGPSRHARTSPDVVSPVYQHHHCGSLSEVLQQMRCGKHFREQPPGHTRHCDERSPSARQHPTNQPSRHIKSVKPR